MQRNGRAPPPAEMLVPFDISRDCQPDKEVDPSYPVSRGIILLWEETMAYTPASNESGLHTLLNRRIAAAKAIIAALERQAGLDTLPAQVAMARILTGVFKLTGVKFKPLGHGRMRWTFDVVSPGEDLGIVLKLGSKQATARDIALTLAFPEDRAQIYAATEHGVVAERVDVIAQVSDPRIDTEAFKARSAQFAERYIGVQYEDVGFIGDRIVMVGSSTRVIKKDAANPTSSTRQIRTT
jgi:hypothetical protein